MRSTTVLTARLALLLSVTTVSACEPQERTRLAFPSAEEVKAVIDPKPQITEQTLTSDQAHEQYNADIETWGDGLYAGGARLCRWFKRVGMKLPFDCPTVAAPDPGAAEPPR
jgi:hypothetical protein